MSVAKNMCGSCKMRHHPSATCRIDPPKVFMVGLNEENIPMTVSMWPRVADNDWCGKYVPDIILN